jgi:cytoskeletal protein CcmA (bactofilin family)
MPSGATTKGHLEEEKGLQAASQRDKRPVQHTIIPPGVTITGNLSSAGDLHLEGEIHGHITCRRLTLTGQPMIKGSVKAETVRISGTFDGQVQAKKVALTQAARMTGDIYYETLEVELGASFEGKVAPFSKRGKQAGVSRTEDGDEKEPVELTQMVTQEAAVADVNANQGHTAEAGRATLQKINERINLTGTLGEEQEQANTSPDLDAAPEENKKAKEEISAQVLEEEKERLRFSDNENVEAAHLAMTEISEAAASEYRRVIGVFGEAVDIDAITRKIRMRYANADAISSGLDPSQMNESQIIFELRTMGFEIIALAGGPYSVKDTSGGRVTKPFALVELQEFLKEKRSQFGDCPASAPMRDRNNQEDFDHLLEGLRKEGLPE